MNDVQVLISILISAVITYALRGAAFVFFRDKTKTPKFLNYLGKVLPYAMVAMLVVYCMQDVSFASVGGWLPTLIGCVVAAGSYLLTRKSVLSVFLSTVVYVVLTSFVFVSI